MNKKSSKKLSLDAQTLRNLSASQLDQVAGGNILATLYCTSGCGSGVPGCSAKCASEVFLTCR